MSPGRNVQYWAAGDDGPLNGTPILPTSHKGEDDGGQDVCEACIKCPHDARASRKLLLAVITRSGSVDLAGEGVERSLERRGIFAALLQLASAAM